MKVEQIMTFEVQCVGPETSLREIAGKMRDYGVGAVPVCESGRVIGIVTDRDIVVRGLADQADLTHLTAEAVMSREVVVAFEDQEEEEAATLMREHQVRRLPVLNHSSDLVGVVSLGDLAVELDPHRSGEALKKISMPHNGR
ncbi:MAG TPA: CBS domain-containing protein [Opitutaceae bacterium]